MFSGTVTIITSMSRAARAARAAPMRPASSALGKTASSPEGTTAPPSVMFL